MNLEFLKSLSRVPLVPLRSPGPEAPTLIGRALIAKQESKAHLAIPHDFIFFSGIRNPEKEVRIECLFPIGVLGKIQNQRPEALGIKILYQSICPMRLLAVSISNGAYWADVELVNEWTLKETVADHWTELKELIFFCANTKIGETWDLLQNAKEDMEGGGTPTFMNEKLIWLCGVLLDSRLFTTEQRQGLLTATSPTAAIDYVKQVTKTQLVQVTDTSILRKGYSFEQS